MHDSDACLIAYVRACIFTAIYIHACMLWKSSSLSLSADSALPHPLSYFKVDTYRSGDSNHGYAMHIVYLILEKIARN